jgi:hypothetical protein
MPKHLTFSPESAARNVWLMEDKSVELNEYAVPTKNNTGAYPMTNSRFNSSKPQSSAVRLSRATGNRMWSPELSALQTYNTNESDANARQNEVDMRNTYGNGWVNAMLRRQEAEDAYQKVAANAQAKGKDVMNKIYRTYRAKWGRLPVDIEANAAKAMSALRKMNINRPTFTRRATRINAKRYEDLAKIPADERAEFQRLVDEANREYRDKEKAADEAYTLARLVGVLPENKRAESISRRTVKIPLKNRLSAAKAVANAEAVAKA